MSTSIGAGALLSQPGPLAAAASCTPEWTPTFGVLPGTDVFVSSFGTFDDGTGEALYAAGGFSVVSGVLAEHIAKWDGQQWSPVGGGVDGVITAMTVFDDGTGPGLYVGGQFSSAGGQPAESIAKWDGSSWSPVGGGAPGGIIRAMTVYDDGSGPALFVGGDFLGIGGSTADLVAKWDGASWQPVGGGVDNSVWAMTVFDDGNGPKLFAGGYFNHAGGSVVRGIASWDGSNWTALGAGLGGTVADLEVYDDGTGAALYVAGSFSTAGGIAASRLAKWNGSSWSPVGGGLASLPRDLQTYDDGTGPVLIVGGDSELGGGVDSIAQWDGSSWSPLGTGVTQGGVDSLGVYPGVGGDELFVAGEFWTAGGEASRLLAKWNGTSWTSLGSDVDNSVLALAVHDDGAGPALYAGGNFVTKNRIAKWDGANWSTLGTGIERFYVYALTSFDDGGGPDLYAAGVFFEVGGISANCIARWDGSGWSPLGSGLFGTVLDCHALRVFDDGSGAALYAGGQFDTAGGLPANCVAKWDGNAWSALGTGLNNRVLAFAEFDDGTGPALFVGGEFTTAGGQSASRVAKWDGTSWSALGTGLNGKVDALSVFDDGGGPALYVGGSFTTAGGVPANNVAKWDGTTWTAVGSGTNDLVKSMTAFDDGGGEALYVGGYFDTAGGAPARQIAKWDGATWTALGSGMAGNGVWDMVVHDDGGGDALIAGGGFWTAIDSGDAFVAKWGCASGPTAYCAPANANSVSAGGAVLTSAGAFGTATATFDLTAVPDQPGLLFAGDGSPDLPFGCGRRCVGGSTIRGTLIVPSGNQATGVAFDMSVPTAMNIQYWYRDPVHFGACGDAFNLSNALRP